MVRTVFSILSIALLSACGLKGPLYMPGDNAQAQEQQPQPSQTLPADSGMPSDNILHGRQ